MDCQKAYYILFNAIPDAINTMETWELSEAMAILKSVQLKTEDMYIESGSESDETEV